MRPKPYRLFICLCTFSSMYLWQGFHLAGPNFLSFWFMSLSVNMLSTLGNSCANSHIAANNRNSLNVVFFHLFELAVWVYIYFPCTVNSVNDLFPCDLNLLSGLSIELSLLERVASKIMLLEGSIHSFWEPNLSLLSSLWPSYFLVMYIPQGRLMLALRTDSSGFMVVILFLIVYAWNFLLPEHKGNSLRRP
jgi:hypothetical protein